MRPAFDERVTAENFLDLARRRCVQAEELDVVSRINFVNGNDVRGVKIERRQPLVFLERRPLILRRRHIIISFGGALLERARRVHRRERRCSAILRRFLHPRSHLGRNRHQFSGDDKFPDRLEIFINVAEQTFGRWVLVLHLLENFFGRFGRIAASAKAFCSLRS